MSMSICSWTTNASPYRADWADLWRTFKKIFPEYTTPSTKISAEFAFILLSKFEEYEQKIRRGAVKRGNFCSKVIDQAVEEGYRYDPDFQELRRALREKEKVQE
jgi:hypothetical protein